MPASGIRNGLASLALIGLLVGCEEHRAGEQVGTVVGATGGALLGSQLGDGAAGILGAAAGGVLGGIIGRELGKELDKADAERAQEAEAEALDAPVGTKVAWESPESGNSGSIKTPRETRNAAGRPCREVREEVEIDGEEVSSTVVACKTEGGTWVLQ